MFEKMTQIEQRMKEVFFKICKISELAFNLFNRVVFFEHYFFGQTKLHSSFPSGRLVLGNGCFFELEVCFRNGRFVFETEFMF